MMLVVAIHMNVEELKRIITDQKEELDEILEREGIIDRHTPNEKLAGFMTHPNIVAILGIRRSGKSILSALLLRDRKYGHLNFDDERLAGLETKDLNMVLEAFYEMYGTDLEYIFLDEIQNVPGWELFANRLRRTKKVILTGSNARLLSGELATHLTGRHIDFTLYPFSFPEFLAMRDMGTGTGTGTGAGMKTGTGTGMGAGMGTGMGTGTGTGMGAGMGAGMGTGTGTGMGAGMKTGTGTETGIDGKMGTGAGMGTGTGVGATSAYLDLYSTKKISMVKRELEDYMALGGFPEVHRFGKSILLGIYEDIIRKDILLRYGIRNRKTFSELAKYLISNSSNEISYSRLKNMFAIKDVHTVKNYIDHLSSSYLTFTLERFSFKLKNQAIAPRKIYCVDTGIINTVAFRFSENRGNLMENLVAVELRRRISYWHPGSEIYYWKDNRDREVDFVLKDGPGVKQLIQVTYSSGRDEINRREIRSLLKASAELGCKELLVITWDYEDELVVDGKRIKCLPLWKWLLEQPYTGRHA